MESKRNRKTNIYKPNENINIDIVAAKPSVKIALAMLPDWQ